MFVKGITYRKTRYKATYLMQIATHIFLNQIYPVSTLLKIK
jgi:hypothetical protein